jgi:hypothetical protein
MPSRGRLTSPPCSSAQAHSASWTRRAPRKCAEPRRAPRGPPGDGTDRAARARNGRAPAPRRERSCRRRVPPLSGIAQAGRVPRRDGPACAGLWRATAPHGPPREGRCARRARLPGADAARRRRRPALPERLAGLLEEARPLEVVVAQLHRMLEVALRLGPERHRCGGTGRRQQACHAPPLAPAQSIEPRGNQRLQRLRHLQVHDGRRHRGRSLLASRRTAVITSRISASMRHAR